MHNIASASAFIPYIVQSEFVEANCEALRFWLKKEPGHIDWTPFIRRVARAEGKRYGKNETVVIRCRLNIPKLQSHVLSYHRQYQTFPYKQVFQKRNSRQYTV